ncbi:MAG: hypothetical protein LC135_15445 [Phycisphaerae bacterium]|jgi:hypothetical protein|nr:hypothetical protein [Phycisphaerae bacterium]MCZ2401235.1 hypothetical protein [Phycisphaerae bacterium]
MYRVALSSFLRPFIPSSLLAVFLCGLVGLTPQASGQIQIINGTWDWPDQGLTLFPEGDIDEGAFVNDLLPYGGRLAAAGGFVHAGGLLAPCLAVWDGQVWSALSSDAPNDSVWTLLESGGSLYLGGGFSFIGEIPAKRVAKWDGFSWSGFGNGLPGTIVSLALWDDGSGVSLYAGGNNIFKWDGLAWSLVGGGIPSGVEAMTLFNDGSGTALYICGQGGVAKWNGVGWTSIGGTTGGLPNTLAVFNDGSGEKLYLGGYFTAVGGVPAVCVARWDGESWSAVGNPELTPDVAIEQLRVLDDGSGPALFAVAPGVLQKWDGQKWTRYVLPWQAGPATVQVFDGPAGPMLHIAGSIDLGEYPQHRYTNIARFTRGFACGDFNRDGVTDQKDLGILLAVFNCTGTCSGDADGDGDVDQADLGILLAHFGQKCG